MEEIIQKLLVSDKPITKWVHQNPSFAITAIGLKKANKLKKHLSGAPTTMMVLHGTITYITDNKKQRLTVFESLEIPVEEWHEVIALEDSIFLLIKNKHQAIH